MGFNTENGARFLLSHRILTLKYVQKSWFFPLMFREHGVQPVPFPNRSTCVTKHMNNLEPLPPGLSMAAGAGRAWPAEGQGGAGWGAATTLSGRTGTEGATSQRVGRCARGPRQPAHPARCAALDHHGQESLETPVSLDDAACPCSR